MDPPADTSAMPLTIDTSIDAVLAAHAPESPTTMLVDTLRTELTTLTDQAAVLNAKLVASLDRVATLEDTVYQHTTTQRHKDERIADLERAKAQWEESMNTGLLVERTAVKAEMQRLVEGLVEEERRRGSAEEGRARVENEVDDLSATLFEQANTMVAAEKMARTQAENRLREAEENLAAAEAAMRDMQQHLQSLPSLLPAIDVGRTPSSSTALTPGRERSYNTSHIPYAEFTAFISYLRTHKPRRPDHLVLFPAPTLASLLTQPFLARAEREDVEPSLRLDAAPDLSWLTRRSVTQAILAGDLIIEPVSVNTLRAGKEYAGVHPADIACSMCGKHVVKPAHDAAQTPLPPPPPPKLATSGTGRNGSTSRFSFKPFFSSPSATPPSPSASPRPSTTTPRPAPTSLFIFRITTPDATHDTTSRMYPLCANGWCLARLRAVCEWWRFVRVCMVDVLWRGDDGHSASARSVSGSKRPSMNGSVSAPMTPTIETTEGELEQPDLPPRKSGWSLGFKGLGGGRGLGLSKPGSPTSKSPMPSPGERTQEEGGLGAAGAGEGNVPSGASEQRGEAVDDKPEDAPDTQPEAEKDVDGVPSETHAAEDPARDAALTETAETPSVTVDAQEDTPVVSSAASESSEPVNGFSTPQSTSAPLSPPQPEQEMTDGSKTEENAAEDSAAPHDAEHSIDLSSPRIEPTPEPPQTPSTPAASASDPTPTPPRPARRAVPAPPTAPAVPERSRARPASLTLEPKPETEEVPITPDPAQGQGQPVVTPVTAARPPVLPVRTEKRGSLGEAREEVNHEAGELDSWEGKTWREVVRLKEEMWKARVGVTEADT